MSPEQASARLKLEDELSISHETIFQYIYADKRAGGELWRHLRCQKPRRKRYASGFDRRATLCNRVSIDERPEMAEQRVRIGDWEGDTVIGKNHKGALVTLTERKSRYVLAGQLRSKHSAGVTAKINSLLRPYKHKCHTVTFGNSKEFLEYKTIALELEADIKSCTSNLNPPPAAMR